MILAPFCLAIQTYIAPIRAQDEGARYAFIIGIDQYEDNAVPQLTGAVADAHAIRECLVKYCHFDPANITMLTSDGDKLHQPTWRNISSQSAAFCSKPFKSNDLVFFYYAGHAVEVGGSPFLVPKDATMTAQSIIGDYTTVKDANKDFKFMPEQMNLMQVELPFRMSELPVKNVIAIFDMCREAPWDSVDPSGTHVRAVFTTSMQNGLDMTRSVGASGAGNGTSAGPTAEAVFFACQPGHASHEENGRGDFTLALEKGLEGAADPSHSGEITVAELKTYLEKEVPEISRNQQQPYGKMEGTGIEVLPISFAKSSLDKPGKDSHTAVAGESTDADSHTRGIGSQPPGETGTSGAASSEESALFQPNTFEFLPGRQWCDMISGEGGFTIRAPIRMDPSNPPQRKIIDIPGAGKNAPQTKMVSYICQGTDHYKYFRFAASFAQDPNPSDTPDQILSWGESLMRQKEVSGDSAVLQDIANKVFVIKLNGNPITNLFGGHKKQQDEVKTKEVDYGVIKGKRYWINKADGSYYVVQLLALKNRLYMFQEFYQGGDGTTPFPVQYFVDSLEFYPQLEDTSDQILPLFQTDELH